MTASITPNSIEGALAGQRIAITGTTGFLGTNLVERILREIPDTHLVLLVRPGRRGAQQRVDREILRNDCFDRLREMWGADEFKQIAASRITAVAADITKPGLGLDPDGRDALASCSIVIHSAASVSFDNPLDVAVNTNLMGPVELVSTLHDLGVTPHLIAVSTAYVAGTRKGDADEELLSAGPFAVEIDWRAEVDSARRHRIRVEDESRTPKRLDEFAKQAVDDVGAAGYTALASRTEQHRNRWVKDQLVDLGLGRASSLGFPDAYAFTKAMAEEAICETRITDGAEIPVSIVRPSIIESALAEPFAGWIRGFRMAEPVIIGFGRGLLKDFPGVPEGAVDVIPVDLVVATIIAVAAHGPRPEPHVVQVASGGANPFHFQDLMDWGTEWFRQNPVYDERDQPIAPPQWTYPSRDRVLKQLGRATSSLKTAERVMKALPVRGEKAMIAADLEQRRDIIERALGYVELYGKYVECEAVYAVDNLIELWKSLSPEDQERFNFDPRSIDWHWYFTEIHLPSVVSQGRVKTAPSGKGPTSRSDRLRKQVLSEKRQLAAFDLENTLIASNVVGSWGWLATRRLSPDQRVRLVARTLAEGPSLLALDRRDRSDFLRHFYRRYKGAPVDQMEEDAAELFSELLLANSFPAAIRRVREHRAAGHRTVLITGALHFVVEPLRPLFDDIIAAEMRSKDGKYIGQLNATPPTGESRAAALRQYAALHELDLNEAVAYADSTSDLPMLEAVGFPVAVNPETKLAALASRRGWLIENFTTAEGGTNKRVPIAANKVSRNTGRFRLQALNSTGRTGKPGTTAKAAKPAARPTPTPTRRRPA